VAQEVSEQAAGRQRAGGTGRGGGGGGGRAPPPPEGSRAHWSVARGGCRCGEVRGSADGWGPSIDDPEGGSEVWHGEDR
jgi:hypothetical protein